MKKIINVISVIILASIIVLILTIGYFMSSKKTNAPENISHTIIGNNIVEITEKGFSPSEIKVSVGETVNFVNKDTSFHRPAADNHPTHKEYPDNSDGCKGVPFDSCENLKEGEVYSFVFNHQGQWNYHDHLKPWLKGIIIVQ